MCVDKVSASTFLFFISRPPKFFHMFFSACVRYRHLVEMYIRGNQLEKAIELNDVSATASCLSLVSSIYSFAHSQISCIHALLLLFF